MDVLNVICATERKKERKAQKVFLCLATTDRQLFWTHDQRCDNQRKRIVSVLNVRKKCAALISILPHRPPNLRGRSRSMLTARVVKNVSIYCFMRL